MDILHFLFGIFGNATGLFLFLSPTITFRRIIKSRSTEQFSGVPYVMTLLNCLLSTWYGLPFVSPHNILVSVINGAGSAIESVYVMIFLIFASKKEKVRLMGLLFLVLTIFSVVVLVSLFALHGNARKLFSGFAASIFSIIMYASPLSVMVSPRFHFCNSRFAPYLYNLFTKLGAVLYTVQRLVIKTKSVEFMPFFLSLFVFLCGTSWFIYGLLGRDPFLFVPNAFGCVLGTMQLILYAIYRKNEGGADTATKGGDFIEMGLGKPQHEEMQRSRYNLANHEERPRV